MRNNRQACPRNISVKAEFAAHCEAAKWKHFLKVTQEYRIKFSKKKEAGTFIPFLRKVLDKNYSELLRALQLAI